MPGILRIAWAIVCGVHLSLATAGAASAQDLDALYQAKAVVTGQSEENRIPGFADCLRQVVAKVSGDQRLLGEPAFEDLLPKAGEFVSSFRYRDRLEGIPIHDEQGTYDRPHDLTCIFDRTKIDAVLQSFGRKPWLAPRPRLVVFLGVRQNAKTFTLTSDGGDSPYMGRSFHAAATPLAITILLPPKADLTQAGLDFEALSDTDMAALNGQAKAAGGDLALAGSIVWSDEDLGWVADWRLAPAGETHYWQVRGVSFDEAFRVAMRGAVQILSGNGSPN
ncbi:DUF2066 domain-containing protein [Mesorhizobium sp. AaZ16]|uniref:DUF2066 domain-containing protein n=1 Tax=Mesorhizobium sp. AaZ16 TaxID=3402289 RepID=UPI00374F60DC